MRRRLSGHTARRSKSTDSFTRRDNFRLILLRSISGGGVQEQTRQSLLNVQAILAEAGLTLANVVKTTVFLADMGDFAAMNEIYAQFFTEPFPARSAIAVKALPKGALVEIEVVAAR